MGEPRRKSRRCGDPAGSAPPRLLPAAGGSAQLGAQRYGAGRRCGTECRGAARALRGAGRRGPIGAIRAEFPPQRSGLGAEPLVLGQRRGARPATCCGTRRRFAAARLVS